jgi:predicted component of type VI protein secretion system
MSNSQRLLALRRELSALRSKIADVESEMVEIAFAIQKDEMLAELKGDADGKGGDGDRERVA